MKKQPFFLRLSFLYGLVIFWTLFALLTGGIVHSLSESSDRILAAVMFGILLSLIAVYLIYGYLRNAISYLKNEGCFNRTFFLHLKQDKSFRIKVFNAFGCVFAFANALMNYTVSYYGHTWFFLSLALIYALVFFMKLFLLSFDTKGRRPEIVIGILILLMGFASTGVVILLFHDETGFSKKDLIIYWNCLYTFYSIISAIVGVSKAIKSQDIFRRRFLSVKLSNAIYSVFNLTVVMVLTFSDEEGMADMILLSEVIGIVCTLLIFCLGISQFLFTSKDKAKASGEKDMDH